MAFITKNNILNNAQHGFREGKSTKTELSPEGLHLSFPLKLM
jgi:hypothetical protein